jgi:hypothetical protein
VNEAVPATLPLVTASFSLGRDAEWPKVADAVIEAEKSKRSAQDYNEIKRRLGEYDSHWKCLNLLTGKYLLTIYRLV